MRRTVCLTAIGALVLILLALTACITEPATPLAPVLLSTPVIISDQATQVAALTQAQYAVDIQAVATAEIVRANAQATLNSADATLQAAQTQEQGNINIIAAQVAATLEIARANAQATLVAAGSTQSAALTLDAIRQQQTAVLIAQDAVATLTQQHSNALAAGTQTAVANLIATQTQSALATSQWYDDQSRQRAEQIQGPLAFLWTWCLPVFLVLLAGLIIWGIWRWLKIQQANQRILESPVETLLPPPEEVIHPQNDDLLTYPENNIVNRRHPLTEPDDQVRVRGWLDEVKRELRSSDQEDKDDGADN